MDDDNKEKFDKVNLGETNIVDGQNNMPSREIVERELIKRLSAEKHRLAAEMEIKFKEATAQRNKLQEQKFRELIAKEHQCLESEKQKFEKALKEKYSKVMKAMLQEKEQQIQEKIQTKYYANELELRQKIEKLQQELKNQENNLDMKLTEVKLIAKREQENASRALYDSIMQSERDKLIKQTEERLEEGFQKRIADLTREHEISLKKHTAKLMNTYQERLNAAVAEQEQLITNKYSDQITRQGELFNHRLAQEVQTAVNAATSKLELEFVKEKQTLQAQIESLRPELETNRLRMRVEVEKELREEFDIKYAQYKQKIDAAKMQELEMLITTEKQKLAEAMQEENMVVLKYKEREIREKCESEYINRLQTDIQKNLQDQEKRLKEEHEAHLQQTIKILKDEHALQMQAEVIQERARITEKNINEKKMLLQQQQTNLEEQYSSDIAHKLAMQAQSLKQAHQIEIANLEKKIQELTNIKPTIQYIREEVPVVIEKPVHEYLVDVKSTIDPEVFENEKRLALAEQAKILEEKFEEKMKAERAKWEQQRSNGDTTREAELQACEQKLRREFQGILEQQRLLASANFAKQRDVEIRATIAQYKQKLLNEMQIAQESDLIAAEQHLKQQYEERIKQHAELARVEVERTKDALIQEQNDRIQTAVNLQIEAMRKEQDLKFAQYVESQDEKLQLRINEEKKELSIKFAQDKANLIKELTAKFAREKHIAMNKYETELREKLYKEMVKQKEFIQTKFTHAQDTALQEQKRRLEAQHKHELERIKQGFFDPSADISVHDEIIVERDVEKLADKILSKFQKQI